MTHKAVRVDNLMYNGCEAHWKCTVCGKCVPFHCYSKSQFESQECFGKNAGFPKPVRKLVMDENGKVGFVDILEGSEVTNND